MNLARGPKLVQAGAVALQGEAEGWGSAWGRDGSGWGWQQPLVAAWRQPRRSQASHSHETRALILLLCSPFCNNFFFFFLPFLIKLCTNGCVICQRFVLTVLERKGPFM